MNSKRANWSFLITIIIYTVFSFGFMLLPDAIRNNLFWNNLLCELILVLPVILFVVVSREKPVSFMDFHRIKPGTAGMIVLFTFLSMPFLTLLNLITQFWVENEAVIMMDTMNAAQMPYGLLYLSIGIIAPVMEEIACRGAFFHSYEKSGSVFKAMILSAVVFAFMHMNFNQAAYAFAVGIFSVLLLKSTGSLWASILYHGVINGSQVTMMYFIMRANPDMFGEQTAAVTTEMLILSVAAYLMLTAITLPFAIAVLVWIGNHEGRPGILSLIWKERKEKKDKMATVPFVLALILCVGMMSGIIPILVSKALIGMGLSF